MCVPERDREGRLLIYALLAEAKKNERTKGIVLIPPPLPLHDSHEHTFKFWLKVGWFSNVPDIIMVSFFDGEVLW